MTDHESERDAARREEHTIKKTLVEKGDARRIQGSTLKPGELRRQRKHSKKGGTISRGGEGGTRRTPHVTKPHG